MTDEELLRLAAKAMNYKVTGVVDQGGEFLTLVVKQEGYPKKRWNPLTNGMDTFGIACKFNFGIHQNPITELEGHLLPGFIEVYEQDAMDPIVTEYFDSLANQVSLTCRAITKAAALLGKVMP